MTAQRFRGLALGMPEASEAAHMGHPDFRVGGKIFATLGYPDQKWAMVKLTPEQQEALVAAEPAAFLAVKGAWGRGGATNVCLKAAKLQTARLALAAAWRNVAPLTVQERHAKAVIRKKPLRSKGKPQNNQMQRTGRGFGGSCFGRAGRMAETPRR